MSKKQPSSREISNESRHRFSAFVRVLGKKSIALFFFGIIFVLLVNTKSANFYSDKLFQNLDSFTSPQSVDSKFINSPSSYPQKKFNSTLPPLTSAKSLFIVDPISNVVLFSHNPDSKLLPASTTKLMTAVVALESCVPDKVAIVKRNRVDGTVIGLSLGERITVRNLLFATLITSANDAAFALADNCADSYQAFITRMNEKAVSLNMLDTNFSNPAGLDSSDLYSTAGDLAKLAKVAFIESPIIEQISNTKTLVINNNLANKTYPLININELLFNVLGVIAGKTGTTEGAGQNLITLTDRNGRELIVVLLGSENRFEESKLFIEWAYQSFDWVEY